MLNNALAAQINPYKLKFVLNLLLFMFSFMKAKVYFVGLVKPSNIQWNGFQHLKVNMEFGNTELLQLSENVLLISVSQLEGSILD